MKQLAGHMGGPEGPAIAATLYTPNAATKPVPVLVSITFNFAGGRRPRAGMQSQRTLRRLKPKLRTQRMRKPSGGTASTNVPRPAGPRGGIGSRGTPLELISNHFAYASIIYNSIETDAQSQANVNLAHKLGVCARANRPGGRSMGHNRRLGLGHQPVRGLLGN